MKMKAKSWKSYAVWILLTEAVGGLAGLLTRSSMEIYKTAILKPPLSPPALVFPIVWSVLYALMGVGAARIWRQPPSPARSRSLRLYLLQLFFNFVWPFLFFSLEAFGPAFLWLAALWFIVLRMILSFWDLDRPAAWLQIPYLVWLLFAAYLNLGVWTLN